MDREGFLQLPRNVRKSTPFQFLSIPDDDDNPQMTFLNFKGQDVCKNFLSLDTESQDLPVSDDRQIGKSTEREFKRVEREFKRVDHVKVDNIISQYQKSQELKSFVEKRVVDVVDVSIQTFVDSCTEKVKAIDPSKLFQTNSAVQTEMESPTVQDPFLQVTWISRANELRLQGYRSLILNENISLLDSSGLASMALHL
jgi:hypothetical protein